MGKGDKRTRKGKIINKSYGNVRKHLARKKKSEAKAPAEPAGPAKPSKPSKPAAKKSAKKQAAKKSAAKKPAPAAKDQTP